MWTFVLFHKTKPLYSCHSDSTEVTFLQDPLFKRFLRISDGGWETQEHLSQEGRRRISPSLGSPAPNGLHNLPGDASASEAELKNARDATGLDHPASRFARLERCTCTHSPQWERGWTSSRSPQLVPSHPRGPIAPTRPHPWARGPFRDAAAPCSTVKPVTFCSISIFCSTQPRFSQAQSAAGPSPSQQAAPRRDSRASPRFGDASSERQGGRWGPAFIEL